MDKRQTEEERYVVNRFNEYKEFIKDKHVSFIIKKTERIVYGVYMLARFVPAEDTLTLDLKKNSHALLETSSHFVSTTGISQTVIDSMHSHLQYLSSLLSLAFISGYISSSNIEIMKNEINYLHKHIEELSTHSASERGQLQIKSEHFIVQQHKVNNPIRQESTAMSFIKKEVSRGESNLSFKKIQNLPLTKSTVSTPKPKPVTQSLEQEDDREKRVLDVIRDKGVVSIKDISTVVFDVSEKTIQRTLQLLIDKGQIKKDGERRWAKYQLV